MKRYSRGFCKILFDRLDIFIEFGFLEFILNEVSGCGKSMEKIIFIDDQILLIVLYKLQDVVKYIFFFVDMFS